MQSFSADLIDLCEKHGMHSFVAAFTVVGGDHNHHFGMLSGGCRRANEAGAKRIVERLEEVNPEPPRRRKH
jgi:hypothetical protein